MTTRLLTHPAELFQVYSLGDTSYEVLAILTAIIGVKNLLQIYEYLPIENNAILVNNSLILTNVISYKIVRDIYAF